MHISLRFHPASQEANPAERLDPSSGAGTAPVALLVEAPEAAAANALRPMVSESEVLPPTPGEAVSPAPVAPGKPPHKPSDFATAYGEVHRLHPNQFVESVLRRTMSVRAILFGYPILMLLRGVAAADRDFLVQVGRVTTMDQYIEAENAFRRQCGRRSFARDLLRFRVSSRRLRRLVAATFAAVR